MGRPGRGHAQRSSRSSSIGRDTLFLRMSRERKKFFFATEAAASTPKNRCVYRELSSRLDRQAEGDVGPASAQAWDPASTTSSGPHPLFVQFRFHRALSFALFRLNQLLMSTRS